MRERRYFHAISFKSEDWKQDLHGQIGGMITFMTAKICVMA